MRGAERLGMVGLDWGVVVVAVVGHCSWAGESSRRGWAGPVLGVEQDVAAAAAAAVDECLGFGGFRGPAAAADNRIDGKPVPAVVAAVEDEGQWTLTMDWQRQSDRPDAKSRLNWGQCGGFGVERR